MAYYLVTADTDLTGAGKGRRVASWHFAETAAAVAQVLLRNGSVSGDIVARINLAASTSASQAYSSPQYLHFPAGLFVDVLAGTVVGSVDLL
jgi:hypothetical protein